MQVHRQLSQLPVFNKAVITIGSFDGVHTGHQQIIRQLKEEAAKVAGETVIITFYPHPRKVIGTTKNEFNLLNTMDEKIVLLSKEGIDHLVIVPFTRDFSDQPAVSYIKDFLVSNFHPHTIIIGYDHRFGKNREGDFTLLEKYKKEFGYKVKEIPEHVLNEVTVSSSKIREAILAGDVSKATDLLGYSYFFEGLVVHGDKRGRTIGFPTANLRMEDKEKLIPGNGVYAVTCQLSTVNRQLKGMMNIGVRPTVDGLRRMIEVNLFDFDEDIYGKLMKVQTVKRLRDEKKFGGLDELKQQLQNDRQAAMQALL
ncbi:MAG: bifunctional riboflavin kinase/FAD synthetase [Sphingobacteriales bacterium]|nr:MAG: bifunctional riboflavin kinase/FAD synthetase [Sphingobacteriales bacterium]